jgi:hypothetical protein
VNDEEYMPSKFTESSQRGRRKVASVPNPQRGIIVASIPNRGNQTHLSFDLNNFLMITIDRYLSMFKTLQIVPTNSFCFFSTYLETLS